jgi:hypothetical protein
LKPPWFSFSAIKIVEKAIGDFGVVLDLAAVILDVVSKREPGWQTAKARAVMERKKKKLNVIDVIEKGTMRGVVANPGCEPTDIDRCRPTGQGCKLHR